MNLSQSWSQGTSSDAKHMICEGKGSTCMGVARMTNINTACSVEGLCLEYQLKFTFHRG